MAAPVPLLSLFHSSASGGTRAQVMRDQANQLVGAAEAESHNLSQCANLKLHNSKAAGQHTMIRERSCSR